MWPTSPAAPGLIFPGILKLSCITSLSKPLALKGNSFSRVFLWRIWFWLSWGLRTMVLKYTPNIDNYSAYNNHDNPPALYSLKSFKYMFTATNHQANDRPKTGTLEKEWWWQYSSMSWLWQLPESARAIKRHRTVHRQCSNVNFLVLMLYYQYWILLYKMNQQFGQNG